MLDPLVILGGLLHFYIIFLKQRQTGKCWSLGAWWALVCVLTLGPFWVPGREVGPSWNGMGHRQSLWRTDSLQTDPRDRPTQRIGTQPPKGPSGHPRRNVRTTPAGNHGRGPRSDRRSAPARQHASARGDQPGRARAEDQSAGVHAERGGEVSVAPPVRLALLPPGRRGQAGTAGKNALSTAPLILPFILDTWFLLLVGSRTALSKLLCVRCHVCRERESRIFRS